MVGFVAFLGAMSDLSLTDTADRANKAPRNATVFGISCDFGYESFASICPQSYAGQIRGRL